jgi:hypothetical protein
METSRELPAAGVWFPVASPSLNPAGGGGRNVTRPELHAAISWVIWQMADWQKKRSAPGKLVSYSCADLDRMPATPLPINGEREKAYRRGFRDGAYYATECIDALAGRGGFARPQEISNIIADWAINVLGPWILRAISDVEAQMPNARYGHPRFNHESWGDIRARILRRDNGRCVQCDDVIRLEVHHRTPVQQGGLPADDNLETLCCGCHRKQAARAKGA